MHIERTAPIAWIVAALAGGVLFLLGGVVTTMSATPRLVMAGGAIALVALGVYAAVVARRNVTLARRHGEMATELGEMLRADTSLRTRMAYTLRDPLTAIFGFADHMAESRELPFDERRDMLIAIRNDAREVEQSLSELAGLDGTATGGLSIEAVVLLDEEVASIASTITTDGIFESDLAPAKAWGDSAKVRQILRTMLRAATSSGCAYISLQSSGGSTRATVSISGRDDLLSASEIAALTGNTVVEDKDNPAYCALRVAYEIAASMRGSIGYGQAFGMSHIVLELPAARSDLRVRAPRTKPSQPFDLSSPGVDDPKPERSTNAVNFS